MRLLERIACFFIGHTKRVCMVSFWDRETQTARRTFHCERCWKELEPKR